VTYVVLLSTPDVLEFLLALRLAYGLTHLKEGGHGSSSKFFSYINQSLFVPQMLVLAIDLTRNYLQRLPYNI